MGQYKLVAVLTAHDKQMPDGTFDKNEIVLEYEGLNVLEAESVARTIMRGAVNCLVDIDTYEMVPEEEEEFKEVV